MAATKPAKAQLVCKQQCKLLQLHIGVGIEVASSCIGIGQSFDADDTTVVAAISRFTTAGSVALAWHLCQHRQYSCRRTLAQLDHAQQSLDIVRLQSSASARSSVILSSFHVHASSQHLAAAAVQRRQHLRGCVRQRQFLRVCA